MAADMQHAHQLLDQPGLGPSMRFSAWRRFAIILAISCSILLIHGYHYGIEDESIYLPAVKKLLNPSLYPHDARFFAAQTGLTVFPPLMAFLSRVTGLSVHWTFFIVYCASVFLFVRALRSLAERVFTEETSRWAAVLLPSALWTMPVAGTALFIMDQHMHPRNLAVIALLYALLAVLDGRVLVASLLVAAAAAIHPLMALYGASLLILFAKRGFRLHLVALAVAIPLAWFLAPPVSAAWRQAVAPYCFLSQWEWYEWLGIVGPLAILTACGRWAGSRLPLLSRIAERLVRFGLLYFLAALLLSYVPRFARLVLLQPMRSLVLIYLLMFFLGGGILAQLFRRRIALLAVLFLGLCGGMFYAQRDEFPATPHIEWPFMKPANEWLQAFDWIRRSAPAEAYFVLDPRYAERPGEDFHGFRAFAERSVLADEIEDKVVASLSPALAEEWWAETQAQRNWSAFDSAGLRRLNARFGVDWVLLERANPPYPAGLVCPYENARIRVCRIE